MFRCFALSSTYPSTSIMWFNKTSHDRSLEAQLADERQVVGGEVHVGQGDVLDDCRVRWHWDPTVAAQMRGAVEHMIDLAVEVRHEHRVRLELSHSCSLTSLLSISLRTRCSCCTSLRRIRGVLTLRLMLVLTIGPARLLTCSHKRVFKLDRLIKLESA